jgi:hypothetical protein
MRVARHFSLPEAEWASEALRQSRATRLRS